jgi:hypothetical protein
VVRLISSGSIRKHREELWLSSVNQVLDWLGMALGRGLSSEIGMLYSYDTSYSRGFRKRKSLAL